MESSWRLVGVYVDVLIYSAVCLSCRRLPSNLINVRVARR